MLIDSHCHLNRLDLKKYEGDMDRLIEATHTAGIECVLNVCVDLESAHEVVATAQKYPNVYASIGLHPSDVKGRILQKSDLLQRVNQPKVIAVGETGLDYHYNTEQLEEMRASFCLHIEVARETKKPLIIHTRNARADTLRIMREEKADEIGGVMHCFTENLEMAKAAIDLGFYISFSGIITFKNAEELQEVARQVPLENILIETDAPYLTPIPYRGKSNEPQYVRYVAEKIAELKNMSFAQVAEVTTQNFKNLFCLS